jgi:DNA polymerase-1
MRGTLILDIETHGAEHLYTMPSREFVRLIGYKWRGQPGVTLTTSLDEIREQILQARWIIGHNIHSFDLPAIWGPDSNVPLRLAMERRVYDTWTHAVLVNPAPYQYEDRNGRMRLANSPDKMKSWFSLDNQAFQLGVDGKTHDLKALAKKHGGFGEIPVDDPEYREYLEGDVRASEAVAQALLAKGPLDAYALREQEIEARKAVIQANGLRVDRPAAEARVAELAGRREVIMAGLTAKYDFPTEGKSPWSTKEGKAAILAALKDAGITSKTRPEWTRTAAGELSLGGDTLKAITAGTEAEELGNALAELKGQRSLAQLALDSMHSDGLAHPEITMLQRSGRWSTTKPGLTVWTAHGPNAIEKRYFLPDSDDEVLLEIDYSNADARAVAAYSGDKKYAQRFEPGADGHLINAWIAWGKDVVGMDKRDPTTDHYRQLAKPGGHGWGYRIGARKLAATWGLPVPEAKRFLDRMNGEFRAVVGWQDRVTAFAAANGYVLSDWGRRMPVEKDRAYTQAPALLGQNATREIVCDAILALPVSALRKLKMQIHDALGYSVRRDRFEETRDYLIELMSASFAPSRGGQRIDFPVEAGPPGANWYEAAH